MIKYGVVGADLTHSLSPEVHNMFFDAYSLDGKYEKIILDRENLKSESVHEILQEYKGINVSSPYKEPIIKFLDGVSDEAKEIGSVNTINNINGTLIGYNTDAAGFQELLKLFSVNPRGKVCVILGSGGAAKSVCYALKKLHAKEIVIASIKTGESINGANIISYDELPNYSGDMLINTTPVGMYPNVNKCIVKQDIIMKYEYIIDLVYNPIYTKLLQLGVKCGKKCISGLYMLVSQGMSSESYWQGINMYNMTKRVYFAINIEEKIKDQANIYITGMESCGKTELGKCLAKKLNKEFIDLDDYIAKISKKTKDQLYEEGGEENFREWEMKAVQKISLMHDKVIALGGGAILKEFNLLALRLSGVIVLRDRPLDKILQSIDTSTKEGENQKEKIIRLYNERYPIYVKISDYILPYGELELDSNKVVEIIRNEENKNN